MNFNLNMPGLGQLVTTKNKLIRSLNKKILSMLKMIY